MGKSSVTFSLLVHSTRFRALSVLALSLLSAIAIGTLYSTGSADLPGQDEQPVVYVQDRPKSAVRLL